MTRLYEIAHAHRDLQAIDGLAPEDIADTIDAVEGEFGDKVESILAVRQGMLADIVACRAEIERLLARAKAIEGRDAAVRDYLLHHMRETGIKSVKRATFSVTFVGGRATADVFDADALPDEYVGMSTKLSPKKAEILAALKGGAEIPGARLGAGADSLRVS